MITKGDSFFFDANLTRIYANAVKKAPERAIIRLWKLIKDSLWINGNFKTIAIFSKKARGMMTRFIIDNNISDIDSLKSFNYDGYLFHEELSTDKNLVFTR